MHSLDVQCLITIFRIKYCYLICSKWLCSKTPLVFQFSWIKGHTLLGQRLLFCFFSSSVRLPGPSVLKLNKDRYFLPGFYVIGVWPGRGYAPNSCSHLKLHLTCSSEVIKLNLRHTCSFTLKNLNPPSVFPCRLIIPQHPFWDRGSENPRWHLDSGASQSPLCRVQRSSALL